MKSYAATCPWQLRVRTPSYNFPHFFYILNKLSPGTLIFNGEISVMLHQLRLSPSFWRNTLDLGKPHPFPRRSDLLPADGRNDPVVVFVECGIVRLAASDANGREITLFISGPGTVLASDLCASSGLRISCISVTECLAHLLDKRSFLKHIETGGPVSSAAFAQCEALSRKLLLNLVEMHTLTAKARLMAISRQLADASLGSAVTTLKQHEIAEILGVSPSYLSRITSKQRSAVTPK